MNIAFKLPLLVVLLLSAGNPVLAQKDAEKALSENAANSDLKLSDREIRMVSEMMAKYEQSDLFSGVVLLAKDGKAVFQKAYGYADREKKLRHELNTGFRLVSVNKLFTIAAILKLVDGGKLSIDDPIGKYMEGFSADISEKVKIFHLLAMTSGFDNYMNDAEYQENPSAFGSIQDKLRLIKKERLRFAPGSQSRYSNSGFIILGAVIEKVTGKNYFEFINETILLPAGMTHTYFPDYAFFKNEAAGYDKNAAGEFRKVPATSIASADGNAVSTAGDLLKFAATACIGEDLLSEKAKVLFFSDFDPNFQGDWKSLKSLPRRRFAWIGGTTGVSTSLAHFTKEDITVIILSNYTAVSNEVAENIRSIMKEGRYSDVQKPVAEKIYSAFHEKGIEFIRENFAQWIKDAGPRTDPQNVLIDVGYALLGKQKTGMSIEIFKLHTALFPADANGWDSLAEAYMVSGNKELAVKNYEKSLELNPQNTNAVQQLKILRK